VFFAIDIMAKVMKKTSVLSVIPSATCYTATAKTHTGKKKGGVRAVGVGSCQVWLVGVSLYGACRKSR